jgi:cytochrome c
MKLKFFNFLGFVLLVIIVAGSAPVKAQVKPRVLVFTKTLGYHHASIAPAIKAMVKLGQENNFIVDTTTDVTKFEESNLKRYAALVFISISGIIGSEGYGLNGYGTGRYGTGGYIFNAAQRADLQRYIEAGGGFVGIHEAVDAMYDWHWYGRMIGANFAFHPAAQTATYDVIDKNFIATKGLPDKWIRVDEPYYPKLMNKDIHVLISLEESTVLNNKYQPSTFQKMGDLHPISWYHDFDGGRAFYTALGHTDESYSDPLFLGHVLGGIKYAIGKNAPLNYAKAKIPRAPAEDRFTKNMLVSGTFTEPTEMTILPNLDILIVQRRGEIFKYDHLKKTVKQVGHLDVYYQNLKKALHGVEDGLLGIQADPDFKTNHYVYMYYSPASPDNKPVNYLSRFTFINDKIDKKTEKRILEIKTDRETCCHTGGSIAFGKDHTLFLSTGDNTSPFDEPDLPKGAPNTNSFAPLDDRPGHETNDDRRSAGNTNDLRGKILRIKINPDGTYDIPDGNLFPVGTKKTRPEIYVMGDRNPYRITVDKKTGFLYWGEVGPDANKDSLATRGPKGYDEINQARKAGFFGWPLFAGPNLPYHEYDYNTGKSGPAFDPLHPLNNSRNNTGLKELPPAQPAFIWYPYDIARDFWQLGSGGRTAMAGPVFHGDMYAKPGLPAYYNGKLFIYDWVRGWIKAIGMTPDGDYDAMEPFMENTKFNSPIDMEVGPDGKLYVLEYGNGWFAKNPDAGLSRIDFNPGNRPPEIAAVTANKAYGALPLTVSLTVKATDPEKDKMTYTWNLGNGVKKITSKPALVYTYTKKGNFKASVIAKDVKMAASKSKSIFIAAGSTEEVADPTAPYAAGKALMLSMDCKSCHKVDEKSIGPAFVDVSKKYTKNDATVDKLSKKIINGGTGVWGDVTMPAHPSLKPDEAKQILDWIYSLSGK